MIDLHIHSNFSPDSKSSVEDIAAVAKLKGLKIIGISDHLEIKDEKIVYDFSHKDFFEKVDLLDGELKVLKGVEFGTDGTVDYEDFEGFDYVMLSVHRCDYEYSFVYECYKDYLERLLRCVEMYDFQILGHLDYPRRYMKKNPKVPDELIGLVERILEVVKEKDAVLEVNTEGFAIYGEPQPDLRILKRAFELNISVTVGSDAHSIENIGRGVDKAFSLLKNIGYKEIAFFVKKRKEVFEI